MARAGRPRPTQREAIIAGSMQARGGLGQMLAQQGAGKDITDAVEQIESTPGGVELLYTLAAEDLMKRQGISKKDAKKIRLYAIGGAVYAEGGGVRAAAEKTRRAGRGEDSMMLHVTPEEYETIEAMWGPADINPETGIGEYGFLKKIFKKVKKAVKKVVKSKIFQVVAPIALSIFAPGLGTAIGSALTGGATGAMAGALGNAVVQGGLGAITGGKEGLLRGAVMGGVTGGLGKMAGTQVQKFANVSDKTANIIGHSLAGGAGTALTGGDFTSGAIMGGLGAFTQPGLESMAEKTRGMLGFEATPGQIFARRPGPRPPTGAMSPAAAQPDLADVVMGTQPELMSPAPTTVTPTALPSMIAPPTEAGGLDLAGLAPLALAALPALGTGAAESVEGGPPPDLPPEFYESLPVYTMNREFRGLADPNAYYTYGQPGAAQSGQHLFITPADPFPLIDPETGELVDQPAATGALPEAVPGAGRIPGTRRFQRGGEFDFWAQNEDVARISPSVSAAGRYVKGPGTGRSDDIEALLSDGEYVVDAESVALLGDGSGDAGAKRLDQMRANLRRHKAKKLGRGEFSHKAKSPEAYMGRLRAAAGRA